MVYNPELSRVKVILDDIGIVPDRSYGQNFLVNRDLARRISANVPGSYLNNIVEIGPGLGVLTEELLIRGSNVRCIEKDERIASRLHDIIEIPDRSSLEIIQGDATRVLPAVLSEGTDVFVVSNLPFNISSQIMGAILDGCGFGNGSGKPFKGGIIMFQKEFANRLLSEKNSKDYGRLTVMFRTKMNGKKLFDVPRTMFHPAPNVDASVVFFGPDTDRKTIPVDEELFSKIVNVLFLNRRKMIKNSLNPPSFGMDLEKEDIRWLIDDLEISHQRPEDLEPDQFILLSNRLSELK